MVRGTLSEDHLIQLKVVKGGYWDFDRSKVPGRNPRIWCQVTLGTARWPEHGAPR